MVEAIAKREGEALPSEIRLIRTDQEEGRTPVNRDVERNARLDLETKLSGKRGVQMGSLLVIDNLYQGTRADVEVDGTGIGENNVINASQGEAVAIQAKVKLSEVGAKAVLVGNLTAEGTIPTATDTEGARLSGSDGCKGENAKEDSNNFFHNQK
jgi:hypothetical protein